MADILTNTIKVTVEKEDFEFRVPSPKDYARMGVVAGAIRRSYDPQGVGSEYSVDDFTATVVRAMAIMAVCLEKSTAKWAFSEVKDRNGDVKVIVDPEAFPPQATKIIVQIPFKFDEEVSRFLEGGA